MRAYVMITGILFGLIALVHGWRVVAERGGPATDPWFILITIVALGLCLWAWRLLRRTPR
jgi:hypothetical protein